ncbi:unnamed protein product [Rotaria sp. Silwood1]|nr:unnamed protein product [Rotaria sp. Silwood1]CAF3471674.1 unnamed protein product [Rotaria sp. Silwood1]CAF4627676.1 unnamed protein product [Rotaria sp. Silwood1]CAF4845839.1 unnamed protein product [Rotaria sp. Silwood1]
MIPKPQDHFLLYLSANSPVLYLINASFKDELINEHLASYSRMYDSASRGCNTTRSLNKEQEQNFPIISKLLITLSQQIVPYPNEYFHGRGIVLTVGPLQLTLARVNLRMIEHSGSQLNVQVNIIPFRRTSK